MTKTLDRPRPSNQASGDSVVVDGTYLRGQAGEAIRLFLTPVSGVWTALVGKPEPTRAAAIKAARRKMARVKVARSKAKGYKPSAKA